MKYRKLTLETTTEAVDYISCLFDELGLEGIEIEDKIPLSEEDKKAMYIDILPELEADDGVAVIRSYIPMDVDTEVLRGQIEEGLKEWELFVDLGSRKLTFEETDDEDWINNWKEFFHPFRAAEHIVIKPTWVDFQKEKEDDTLIEIDPGRAFGTGSHETTKLCIEMLEQRISEGDSVLDIGCGSGILSIISLKLGAGKVRATEIDPIASEVTLENLAVNGLYNEAVLEHCKTDAELALRCPEGQKPNADIRVYTGDVLTDEKLEKELLEDGYEIVVANILADVIVPLTAKVGQYLKPGGVFISSGIIDSKEEEVRQALLENGFEILKLHKDKDWRCFVATIPVN